MDLKQAVLSYNAQWQAVEAIQAQERRIASMELRWQQLNAAYGMAKGLGLLHPYLGEMGVFDRWAKLKEKADDRLPKA